MDHRDHNSTQPKVSQVIGSAVRSGSRQAAQRVALMFSSKGPGFRRLGESHAGSVGGDTLVALALAGTLFFDVPSTEEARQNVALYLVITLAPFAVIGPFLGSLFERFPGAYRGGLMVSSGSRVMIALVMMFVLDNDIWLFPLAFMLLVMSRFHGISRSSVLPVVLAEPTELIAANAQLARIGVFASAVAAPLGGLSVWLEAPWIALFGAVLMFVWSAQAATRLPIITVDVQQEEGGQRPKAPPRSVRLARFATAGVRFLNGFLLLLVGFAFREVDAGLGDFSTLLGAAGVGFFLAAFATPVLDKYISEEPMVVTALAIEAGAAFLAAMVFGLPAAAGLAAAAGLSWGTAKFAFDGLLQSTVPAEHRGRAFTNSETLFQLAWVFGALIPVVPVLGIEFGLALAGIAALLIQVLYVSAVLVPVAAARRRSLQEKTASRADIMDLF